MRDLGSQSELHGSSGPVTIYKPPAKPVRSGIAEPQPIHSTFACSRPRSRLEKETVKNC